MYPFADPLDYVLMQKYQGLYLKKSVLLFFRSWTIWILVIVLRLSLYHGQNCCAQMLIYSIVLLEKIILSIHAFLPWAPPLEDFGDVSVSLELRAVVLTLCGSQSIKIKAANTSFPPPHWHHWPFLLIPLVPVMDILALCSALVT